MNSSQRAPDSPGGPSSSRQRAAFIDPARHGVFRVISPMECFELLEASCIGRVGFTAEDDVMVLPVNFVVSGKTIVFRTAPDTLLALHANVRLSFEVDHFDEALGTGWSVLVRGHAHQVTDELDVKRVENAAVLRPWAPGARDVYVRISPTHISGRSVEAS
jgi:nitroimidazol reductase NimA-like FMN-containing flavoprotein (pyridoxamine 5'-phosphate oxidase superfamily)